MMFNSIHRRKCTIGAVAAVMCAGMFVQTSTAEVIYETEDPFGGPFGLIGFDVCNGQSVGLRFIPDANYTLDQISVWFMNNNFEPGTHPLIEISLQTDDSSDGQSVPSGDIIESWTFNVSAVGWDPMLETVTSKLHPLLIEGERYWVVTESIVECGVDGVWNWASTGTGFMATSLGYNEPWQPGGSGAVAATIIEGALVLAGDLDNDGDVDFDDFTQLLASWGDPGCGGAIPCAADLDNDGDVDFDDFTTLLANWSS